MSLPQSRRPGGSRAFEGSLPISLVVSLLGSLAASGCQVGYVVEQGFGQLRLARSHTPLDAPELESALSASERETLAWVPTILEFCREELGLDPGDAYTTFLDTGGEPISYAVTAAHPIGLVPYRWHFPFAGTVAYKGFFSLEDAKDEARRLEQEGFDVGISPVGAYSTLGWFRDPILSTMLEGKLTDFIDLIIHETVHRTVYFPDDTTFNESLATFVAREGTRRFLEFHPRLRPLKNRYEEDCRVRDQQTELLARLRADLDSLYRSDLPDERKRAIKGDLFEAASRALEVMVGPGTEPLRASNTTVLHAARYHELLPLFARLQSDVGGEPSALISRLRQQRSDGRTAADLRGELAALEPDPSE